ncbi:MAG TPA: UDP-N-acetylmuramoyl-tripeptide--D-alanyl-D-alanine ligase [Rhodanobacteraceae bacterium]|nr:UDP-N-acetylmuramoyl-tripeptide--D-alanyl-D-alanine ligase [Rhodanobacteraceae bacterium]
MLRLRLQEIATWTQGLRNGPDVPVNGVSTDTRKLGGGELFVALVGENHDAHGFVAQAKAAGASAALVQRRVDVDLPQVIVADTLRALGDLASAVRAQRQARVIGITGSNGKTTVKTLTASILKRHDPRTHVNPGNLNNEIGLPLTLLAMPADTRFAVLEMGAGKPGDIAYLAAIARPDIGLVNNIASAHLERMLSVHGIAQTKGALYEALPSDGVALINADEPFAPFFNGLAGSRRKLRFGFANGAEVTATDLKLGERSAFTLVTPAGRTPVDLPLAGRHNVLNALAAAAVALALDVPLATIRAGLEAAPAVAGRLVRRRHASGAVIIDDSYNANPGSFAAAIATLAAEPGETILVMGDMAELGADAERLHAHIGALAKASGIHRLHAVGRLSRAAASAFGAGATHHADQPALIDALRSELRAGVTALVKGSRSSAMDRVVAALTDDGNGGERHAA